MAFNFKAYDILNMIKELNWMLIFFPRVNNRCQTISRVSVNEALGSSSV